MCSRLRQTAGQRVIATTDPHGCTHGRIWQGPPYTEDKCAVGCQYSSESYCGAPAAKLSRTFHVLNICLRLILKPCMMGTEIDLQNSSSDAHASSAECCAPRHKCARVPSHKIYRDISYPSDVVVSASTAAMAAVAERGLDPGGTLVSGCTFNSADSDVSEAEILRRERAWCSKVCTQAEADCGAFHTQGPCVPDDSTGSTCRSRI